MPAEQKKLSYRVLIAIVSQRLGEKAEALLSAQHIPTQYHVMAKGTATKESLDLLGLGQVDKTVFLTLSTAPTAHKLLHKLRDELYLGTPNTGIAWTVPISGGSAGILRMMQEMDTQNKETAEVEQMEDKYTMVIVLVNQGFSDDVMAAARTAGATGGTVFHSRRVGTEESHHLWGITVQEEREIVMIIADKEHKLAIMKAIGERCGVQSEAQGVVLSMPVDDIVGLKKDS
ncbi:MAG: transposase [Ruminococcaceae bacterium]|nr:transposase [Oscillospiraceae bacterium]